MRWQIWLIGAPVIVIGIGGYHSYNHRYDSELRAIGALYVDRQLEIRGLPSKVRDRIFHQVCCDQPRPHMWKHEGKSVFTYTTENGAWYGTESATNDFLPRAGTIVFYASGDEDRTYVVRVKDRTYEVIAVLIL